MSLSFGQCSQWFLFFKFTLVSDYSLFSEFWSQRGHCKIGKAECEWWMELLRSQCSQVSILLSPCEGYRSPRLLLDLKQVACCTVCSGQIFTPQSNKYLLPYSMEIYWALSVRLAKSRDAFHLSPTGSLIFTNPNEVKFQDCRIYGLALGFACT